ncbi:gliding motility lipoprotein GldD [Sphingobacterium pedocola]|uniref:Gliding motility lipoprotein GldD n=1 Tax=Sphingobacterium pedocola TaxID=2082722 RepID=A0ABR9TC51_9SPHI|nr:gliding motility lipoprotein GldD [Sphingobacterium pedocola]MBE8722942.1 gliding motility lipoprotein GldD [Sphingobacterium pedocola]
MKNNMRISVASLFVALVFIGCQQTTYTPKPRGFFKVDFPERAYIEARTGCPFYIEIPAYSILGKDPSQNTQDCWKNLDFPQFNARLHLSYYRISASAPFDYLTEDARTFVFKHTSKATSIDQKRIQDPHRQIYGVEYAIRGNTASNYQFYISDSTTHYLRGALYFNEKPHLDSIQPVLDFLKEDIRHIISTIRWK